MFPIELITLISVFASEFSKPVWSNITHLLCGAIVCSKNRTVSSILRVLGLCQGKNYSKYHRTLSNAKFNMLNLSKILLSLMINILPANFPIIILADDTIERRKGKRIKAKGCYRDAVRSSEKEVVKCFGLKWECMMLLVPLPFCVRPWALPFMTVLAPSKKCNESIGRKHKTSIDWTIIMMRVICRWLNNKKWILVGDGAYASMNLAQSCSSKGVTLISRFRSDAQLYNFPVEPIGKKAGRKRCKGDRIQLKEYLEDKNLDWQECEVKHYKGKTKTLQLYSKKALWYQQSQAKSIEVRFVIAVDPENEYKPIFLFSTDVDLDPVKIFEYFVLRWNIEVTFEEARAHLGFETQRQWSDKSISRSTPLLLAVFSLVTLFALQMKNKFKLEVMSTAWYHKNGNVTFSDVIAFIRRLLWEHKYFPKSRNSLDSVKLSHADINFLIYTLANTS